MLFSNYQRSEAAKAFIVWNGINLLIVQIRYLTLCSVLRLPIPAQLSGMRLESVQRQMPLMAFG